MKRTVLVTGASRGIGLEFVRQYLMTDTLVVATCRNLVGASELMSLGAGAKGELRVERMDVVDTDSIEDLAKRLKSEGVELNRLISNAGISGEERLNRWTSRNFLDVLNTNSVGPALVAQAFRRVMAPGSVLVNMSSGIGSFALNIFPEGPLDAYAMSKAALNMLTIRLAEKFKAWNIGVVAMSPGWVKTDMGGQEATLEVDESVGKLIALIDGFGMGDSGRFVSVEGEDIEW
ncbi:MAG: SDR family oxidoreductase [Verrucomicrobiota bacterium]